MKTTPAYQITRGVSSERTTPAHPIGPGVSSKGNTLRDSLNDRISRHNQGQVSSTKFRTPLVLLYSEYFDDYSAARKREIYLKTGSGREHLKLILEKWAGTQVAKGGRL